MLLPQAGQLPLELTPLHGVSASNHLRHHAHSNMEDPSYCGHLHKINSPTSLPYRAAALHQVRQPLVHRDISLLISQYKMEIFRNFFKNAKQDNFMYTV